MMDRSKATAFSCSVSVLLSVDCPNRNSDLGMCIARAHLDTRENPFSLKILRRNAQATYDEAAHKIVAATATRIISYQSLRRIQ
jgi:hypothetical protein